jgi:hypothetical protein
MSNQNLYVLRDWIPICKLNKKQLSKNFCQPAVDYLSQQHSDYFNWEHLYKNPYAINLIREHIKTETDDSYMEYLCENPEALDIIEDYIIKFKQELPQLIEIYDIELEEWENEFDNDWDSYKSSPEHPETRIKYLLFGVNRNPKAMPLLLKYPEFISKFGLYRNHSKEATDYLLTQGHLHINDLASNPFAIELIKQHFQNVDFNRLSNNPEAIFMLLANQHLINWTEFSKNTSPFAIHLMKRNLHRLDFCFFSANPSAIYVLEKYQNIIDWDYLSINPKIWVIHPNAICTFRLTKKQRNQFAWEYPRKYLVLRRFVDLISETFYNPMYKWCQQLELKKFNEL